MMNSDKSQAVEDFIRDLQRMKFENTFNPYRDECPCHDIANAACIRLNNLRKILNAAIDKDVEDVWLGRDLGYLGGRRTGLALTDDAHVEAHAKRWEVEAKPVTKKTVTEATATIVWEALSWKTLSKKQIFLWNAFPFHPHEPGNPCSNRKHNLTNERASGKQILCLLLKMLQPRRIIVIGNDAHEAVKKIEGLEIHKVRHPSYGRKAEFQRDIRKVYGIDMKTVLDLNQVEARCFFLRKKSYCHIEIPKYFKFSTILEKISDKINKNNLSDYYRADKKPEFCENVNYKLLNNKDGEYAWRLLQLIHPVLYVELVNQITKEENWKLILRKFKEFQKGTVECASIPVLKDEQETDKEEQILTWWEKVEQKSIASALEYDYIFHADIVDCYGSIYTHSISWALHTKEKAKKLGNKNNNKLIGVLIDKTIRAMANGQTNGIPQGSVLMDFIAEIVLGYIDQELSKELEKELNSPTGEYKIIRYRDDYRIFVNNIETGKVIVKALTNVLSEMGMRLNPEKTKYSDDVIDESIKNDKLYWIINNTAQYNLQKQLLVIYDLSKKHPNSGTLKKELGRFYRKIEKSKNNKKFNQDLEVFISILANIAFKNPGTYPIISAIISKLLTHIQNKEDIIEKIINKFEKLPNTEHLNLWLQRITLKINGNFSHKGKLCEKVENNSIQIWNSDWLKGNLKKIIDSCEIIDQEEIENMEPEIQSDEVLLFEKNIGY